MADPIDVGSAIVQLLGAIWDAAIFLLFAPAIWWSTRERRAWRH